MTLEELNKIPFSVAGHVSYDDEHCTTYTSADGRFGFCDHVPMKDGEPHGRSYRHWRIGAKVYKSLKKFIEALKEIDPSPMAP